MTYLPSLALCFDLPQDPGVTGDSTAQWVEELPANAVDAGSIPRSGRSPGGGNGNPLQYSCLGNPKDRGAWWATVHGVIKSWTWLRASLIAELVKNLPAMQETWVWFLGREDSPGEGNGNPLKYSCLENPHGQRSLVGYSPWGCKSRTRLSDFHYTSLATKQQKQCGTNAQVSID